MKLFITGGTGFIGRHTVSILTQRNHELKLLVRKEKRPDLPAQQNVSLISGNTNDKKSLIEGMADCDAVINLAGHYTFWEPDKRIYSEVNIEGTRNVMESALTSGIRKVIHISTAGIFGKPQDQPFNENSEPGPLRYSEYFRTKYEGDRIAWELFEKKNLPLVVIYPVCVLGAGDTKASGRYIKDFIDRKLPASVFKDEIFSFVYVKDVALAIANALEKENNIGEKYLIGNLKYKWGEINNILSGISGVPVPKINMPNSIAILSAYMLTGLANLIKRPPLWGMATDQMKVMQAGFNVNGSKAERELGISYTPIETAVREAVDSVRN